MRSSLLPVKILRHTYWAKMALAGALLGALWWYLDPRRIWHSLYQVDGSCLGVAAALGGVGILVQWVKWQRLLAAFRPQTTWAEGLHSLLIGFALGMLSPGRVGELGRGVFLGGERVTWMGLAVADRLCSSLITVALGGVGLVILYPRGGVWALGALAVLAGLAALAWPWLKGLAGQWEWVRQGGEAVRRIPGRLWLRTFSWSALFNLVFCGQFYFLLLSWGAVPAGALWGIPLFFAVKVLLPFSIMDLGVREGAAVLVFSQLQFDPVVAFNASFILFILNALLPGLGGLALLVRRTVQSPGAGAASL